MFVKDTELRSFKTIFEGMSQVAVFGLKEYHQVNNKNKLKQSLNEFDVILIDSRINLAKAAKELGGGAAVLMRKRKFPFPVKLSGLNYSEK